MPWPTPQDYNEALQDPSSCFTDEELINAEVRCDRFGMPRPESGNFASVYKLQGQNDAWAIRCFLYQIANRESRYQAISDFLNANKPPFVLPFAYVRDGIKCGTSIFPIIKMKYLDAHTFSHYVSLVAMRKDEMNSLITQIEQISQTFQDLKMAHGDLQHDNILVFNGKIHLVDYDAMFVPALGGSSANELGHPSYQHPSKSAKNFDASSDNFSFWVIRNSLQIIKEIPDILEWPHKDTDGLIFSVDDLKSPQKSRLFHFLEKHENETVRLCARQVRAALNESPADTPSLTDTLRMASMLETCSELPELSFADETKLKQEMPNALKPITSLDRQFAPIVANTTATGLSFGGRTKHKWPEIFNHEIDFGYERLHQLIQKQTPIEGEIPFLPPILHAVLEEHAVLLIVFLITAYVACFLCQGTATVLFMLTLSSLFLIFVPRVLHKYLKDRESVKRSPRGRFLTRVSNILFDGRCTIVEFEVDGPSYARKIIFKAGVPSHLRKSTHRVKHSNYDIASEQSANESNKTKVGMLYFDQGHTDLPIALCAEGNVLFWFI